MNKILVYCVDSIHDYIEESNTGTVYIEHDRRFISSLPCKFSVMSMVLKFSRCKILSVSGRCFGDRLAVRLIVGPLEYLCFRVVMNLASVIKISLASIRLVYQLIILRVL